jgi:hypothetical protein
MNWNYITGFFDADGSVCLATPSVGYKYLQVSFHNNELNILEDIKTFIDTELDCKGSIVSKKKRSENHNISYDLKYSYRKALQIGNKMDSIHPKKVHRFKVYNELQAVIPRSGTYTEEIKKKREELEKKFMEH